MFTINPVTPTMLYFVHVNGVCHDQWSRVTWGHRAASPVDIIPLYLEGRLASAFGEN